MKITPEILFFLFSNQYSVPIQKIGAPGREITGIQEFCKDKEPDRSVLYVLSLKNFLSLPKESRKNLCHVALAGSFPDTETGVSQQEFQGLNAAVADGFRDPDSLYHALLTQYQTLLRQENELLLATLDPKESETVFSFGSNWFPWEYSIVDIDMHLIYRSENLHKVLGGSRVDRIPPESLHELILSREFHEAAKKKEVFYQSMSFNNLTAFARNILPDNQYAGRIVMFLNEPLTKAPKGAEELFHFYTDCIMEALRRSGHFAGRKQNDSLHLLCQSVFLGEQVPAHVVSDAFRPSGWKTDHSFAVLVFRFLSASAWEAQLETTLPYLADELEIEWPFSCAVNTGSEINWILNLTLSKADTAGDSFHQQIAHFVRDHVCLAGISPVFQNFMLLADAKKSATAALEIGQVIHPHFWFFSFDNYRLEYVMQTLQDSLSPEFLRHPAIALLKQYDQKNKTELAETLKAYLEHGRNMSAAADAIFVHRTTFCRRMDHIRSLTGLNLDDLNTALLLEMSYQFS